MVSDKTKLILKIVMIALMVIVLGIVTEFLVEIFAFKMQDPYYHLSFWADHFAIGITLILVGGVAFIMPILSKQKYTDDSKDSIMLIVALLLMLSGIVAMIYSFIAGGFGF